jgi:protein-S-isoprenylcysteine O-methyltransferase Ste14
MAEKLPPDATETRPGAGREVIGRVLRVGGLMVILAVVMFLIAGRLDWLGGWLFIGFYLVFLLAFVIWGTLKAPDLLKERSRRAENVKGWDKVLIGIYSFLLVGLLALAALDGGRFNWSIVPLWVQLLGLVLVLTAGGLIFWALVSNTFLSSYVRIQDDRGHRVVSGGPYRYVRHPMYSGLLVFFPAVALLFGSFWALIPAGLIVVIFVIRTALEDRTLQAELPGYAEYAGRVRYRLIPGVW